MRQLWVLLTPSWLNNTNPNNPKVLTPANRLAIFADWPAEIAAPVSAMSIGSC